MHTNAENTWHVPSIVWPCYRAGLLTTSRKRRGSARTFRCEAREGNRPSLHRGFQDHARDGRAEIKQKNHKKSRAEAMMNRLCGSRQIVPAIWQVGLPMSLATRQRHILMPATPKHVADITHNVMNWLDILAGGMSAHKESDLQPAVNRQPGYRRVDS